MMLENKHRLGKGMGIPSRAWPFHHGRNRWSRSNRAIGPPIPEQLSPAHAQRRRGPPGRRSSWCLRRSQRRIADPGFLGKHTSPKRKRGEDARKRSTHMCRQRTVWGLPRLRFGLVSPVTTSARRGIRDGSRSPSTRKTKADAALGRFLHWSATAPSASLVGARESNDTASSSSRR
jgi:hypothetical protein